MEAGQQTQNHPAQSKVGLNAGGGNYPPSFFTTPRLEPYLSRVDIYHPILPTQIFNFSTVETITCKRNL